MSQEESTAASPPVERAQKTRSLGAVQLIQWFGHPLRARWEIGYDYVDFVVLAGRDRVILKGVEGSPGLPLRVYHELPYQAMLRQVVDQLGWPEPGSYRLSQLVTLGGFCGHNAVVRSHSRGRRPTPPRRIVGAAQRWIMMGRPTQQKLGDDLGYSRSRAGQLLREAHDEGYLDEHDALSPEALSMLVKAIIH
jgi:hypothetical protein